MNWMQKETLDHKINFILRGPKGDETEKGLEIIPYDAGYKVTLKNHDDPGKTVSSHRRSYIDAINELYKHECYELCRKL